MAANKQKARAIERAAITDRLENLRVLLKARSGRSEYANNIVAIRAEIARLEGGLASE